MGTPTATERHEGQHEAPEFFDPEDIFDYAIKRGCLSESPQSEKYAGKYMYMGTKNGFHAFKHIHTRRYYQVQA